MLSGFQVWCEVLGPADAVTPDASSVFLRPQVVPAGSCFATSGYKILARIESVRHAVADVPAPESDAHSAVGRRASTTFGLVTADISGTRSTRAGFAPRVFISGLLHSASSVAAGRHTRIGTRSESGQCLLEQARQPRFRASLGYWLI